MSIFLLFAFAGLFYVDGQVKQNARRLATLTVNAERIQSLDAANASAVRLAAALKSDFYIIDYQDQQDAKYALLEENLKLLENARIRAVLFKMEEAQGEIEDAESEAIGLIDEENWDAALGLITGETFRKQKWNYRTYLAQALREMIEQSRRQSDRASMLAQIIQIGVLGTFLLIAMIGFVYSREMKKSLRRQSTLAADLEDANQNLEQRVSDRTAELEENQGLLNTLVNSLPAVVFLKSPDGRFKLTNREYERLYGLKHEDLFEKTLRDLHPREIAEKLEALDRELIEAKEILTREHDIARDGKTVTLNSVMFPVFDRSGALVMFGGIEIDISARKEAEHELAREKAILDTTLEAMEQGISMYDGDLRLMARNQKFIDLIGMPAELLEVGTLMENAFRHNAEKGEYGDENLEQAVQTRLDLAKKFEAHHFERTRPDGTVLEIRGNPLPDRSGFVSTYTDITARKKAEDTLAAKEAQLRAALDNMSDGLLLLDAGLNFQLYNQRYLELVNIRSELIQIGKPFRAVLEEAAGNGYYGPGDPVEQVNARMAAYEHDGYVETEIVTSDNRVLAVRKTGLDDGGAVAIFTDITERKRAEESLSRQTALLETTMESMDQGITMFDGDLKLVAFNSRATELYQLPEGSFYPGMPFINLAKAIADQGEYGPGESEALAQQRLFEAQNFTDGRFERSRPNGMVLDIRRSMVPGGGFVSTYTDITDRKRAEIQIKKNEEQLARILENSPIGVSIVAGENGRRLFVNSRYAEMNRSPREALIGGVGQDVYVEPDTARQIQQEFERDGRVAHTEVELRRGDGSRYWAILHMFPTEYDGKEARLVWLYDISDQKKAEQEVAEQTAIANAVLQNMDQGVILYDADLNVRAFNERARGLWNFPKELLVTGVSNDQLLDHLAKVGEFGDGEISDELETAKQKARSKEAHVAERPMLNGTVIEIRRRPTPDGGFVATHSDITERKRAEETVARQGALLETTMQSMDQGITMFDGELNLVAYNERFVEIFNLPEDFLYQGLPYIDLARQVAKTGEYGAGDQEELARQRTEEAKHYDSGRFERARPDGIFLDIRRTMVPTGGFVSTFTDITERKQMEVELVEAREAAEGAAEAKAEFLATMSHEIRTPMNGVMSMAEILDQTTLSLDQRGMTRTIRQSAQALLTVINDILDFSKIEAGKLDIEQIPFDLAEVVQSTADLLAPRAEESALDLLVDIDLDVPKRLLGDPTRVRQIMLNLGSNAIKFTPEGHVLFKVRRMVSDGAIRVRIEVTDTGIGLTGEQKGTLFQAFSQADTSTSRKFGGTGLGLSICRRLCEMMQGEIDVESTPGEGSSFWFELPFEVSDEESRAPNEDIAEARVLLVGYGEREAAILRRYLRHGGVTEISEAFAALTSTPGLEDALARFDGAPSLVLVNGKPGLHGIGVELDSLAEHRETKDVPIVVSAPHGLASTLGATSLAHGRLKLLSTMTSPQRVERLWHLVAVALGKAELGHDGPAEDAAVVVYTPPTIEEARRANAVILVAEDNETNQIVIRRILARLGFAFEIADDGAAALALYEDRPFGMLLTDFHMPEMDGFELTAAIRAREAATPDATPMPIIALTADALPDTEQQCLDAGMDGYLRKPIEMERLVKALETHLPQALTLRAVEQPAEEPEITTPVADLSPSQSVDRNIFDIAQLEDSFGTYDADTASFVDDFLNTLEERVADIAIALREGGVVEAREIAHAMKGAANSVGARRMGQIMSDIQDRLDDDDVDTAMLFTQLLPQTFEELKETVKPLNQRLLS